MKNRHKHADLIHAWADGAKIEYFDKNINKWIYPDTPTWNNGYLYRIKPEPRLIKYRNYLTKNNEIKVMDFVQYAEEHDILFFKEWVGDWQIMEVQE